MMMGEFAVTVVLALTLTAPAESAASRVARYIPDRPVSPGTYTEYHGMGQRLVAPLLRRILELSARTAPQRVRKTAAAELIMAGSAVSPSVFLGVRGLLMFGMPVLGALYVLSAGEPTLVHWLVLGLTVIWGRRLPAFWLKRRIRKRQRAIDRRLPYALDLLVACLEGGLSLDASLAKVAEQSGGPLSEEIRRTLQEIT